MDLKKRSKLIFIGDSITDSNRDYDAPLAGWGSFGNGYVNLINAFTTALLPEKEYMIINKGTSGNTIIDLKKRWTKDVLELVPDVVTIMIGINDVWRYYDSVFQHLELVSENKFEETYREIISETLKTKKKIVLMSPFMIEENKDNSMRKKLVSYQNITKKMASEFQLVFVDTQLAFDNFLEYQSSYSLSSDRVHPSTISGHLIIAKSWLDSMNFSWK